MATDGPLNDLIASLRQDGDVDSQGRFTLDRAQARAKMQKFQLVDARRYVLELVQAAVLRGATAIDFTIDADDMRMRFDGPPFTAAELDDLWGSIFADGEGRPLRAVRQLALGLNAALGLAPKRITVRSGDRRLVLRPGRDDEHAALDPPIAGTELHVERRLELGLFVDFLRNLGGRLGEQVHLRARCGHAPIPISLDGARLVRGMRVACAVVEHPFAATGVAGVVALVPDARPAELRLVKDGVWLDTHTLEQCGPGVVVVAAGDGLRKDVSLARIVEDDALAMIAGLARAERWGAFARLVEAVEQNQLPATPWMARMRDEALRHLRLRDLRKRPDAAVLARAIGWIDARGLDGKRRWVTLAELADAIDPDVPTLRHATGDYPLVAADGPPIPQLGRELASVARLLGGARAEAVDAELKRLNDREKARRAWLTRAMEPRLPGARSYVVRAAIAGPGLRGELGIAADAFAVPPRRDGTTWLIDQGCLLAALELPWGVASLDMALEAAFTPTDGFDDVARDAALARAVLHALAALAGPLARWAAGTRGSPLEPGARGLVKSWLQLALDRDERAALWRRLGVGEPHWPDDATAASILRPAAHLWTEGAGLLDLPLFHDFDGAPRSLRELADRLARAGALDVLEHTVLQQPGLGHEVLWLGRGDRTILAALFGPALLRPWQPVLEAILRERAFQARPARDLADIERQLHLDLGAAGLDPARWSRTVRDGDTWAVIALHPGRADAVDLLLAGRTLTTRALDLGVGPLVGAATSAALRPRADWDDVEDDDALGHLCDVLRRAAWSLVADLLERPVDRAEHRDWLAVRLLERLAGPDARRALDVLPDLPWRLTFSTVDGAALPLAEVGAVIRQRGAIEWVPAGTPTAALRDPPVLRLEAAVVHALRGLHGEDALVDGSDRLRRHGLAARLESLPAIDRIALDPAAVFLTASLAGDGSRLQGEIGLSRGRTDGGLALELCTAGRRISVVTDPDVLVPVDAILADPELPLTPLGAVDTRSKRHGQHLRRCRRAAVTLLVRLCERWPHLPASDREPARTCLLHYAARELTARDERGQARGDAWAAVRRLPLFVDVWDRPRSLDDIAALCKDGALDVVRAALTVDPAWAGLERLILVADPTARACLRAAYTLRDVDARWAEEVAHLRALAERPEVVLPDLAKVAWIDRKATVAGDLQARLWIPRQPSDDDGVLLVRGRREVGRLAALPGLPCAGHLQGRGLTIGPGGPVLAEHQRLSLARQVCTLYESLAKQVKSGGRRLPADERDRARAWLVHVDQTLEGRADPLLASLGKPLAQLRAALAELAPPALRRARAKPAAPAEKPAKPAPPPPATPTTPTTPATPPAERFLALVRAELAWARERHAGLLERLGLDSLRLGAFKQPGVARFDRGLVLQERHPLVARQVTRLAAGEDIDPIDLAFLVSAVYTVMNAVADEIDADDEHAFVARLAEGLALELAD